MIDKANDKHLRRSDFRAARLPLNTAMRAELMDQQAVGTAVHVTAIREALEAAGVEFGGAGVRLRKAER